MRSISCVLAAACLACGNCYLGLSGLPRPGMRSEVGISGARGFEQFTAAEYKGSSETTASSWSPLAMGVALGLLAAVLGGPRAVVASDWSHSDIPAWSKAYPACSAKAQSPIDIPTKSAEFNDSTDSLAKHVKYMAVDGRDIVHNGHVMQVNGGFGTFGLPDGDYEVKQFHFHFPAEHKVDGKLGAGELHIVHQRKGATGTDGLAVVGVILEEDNAAASKPEIKFLDSLGFGKKLPKEGEKVPLTGPVDLNAFSEEIGGGFFHYTGSLTTPPCAEGVHWYVAKKTAPVTKGMIKTFKERFPGEADNRPVQPVNGRTLVINELGLKDEFTMPEAAPVIAPGGNLKDFSEELVKSIEGLKQKREELNTQILKDEETKAKIQKDLATITDGLIRKTEARDEYDKTIQETEDAYNSIIQSSQNLINLLKKRSINLPK